MVVATVLVAEVDRTCLVVVDSRYSVIAIAEVDTEAAGVDCLVVASTAGNCYPVDTA